MPFSFIILFFDAIVQTFIVALLLAVVSSVA